MLCVCTCVHHSGIGVFLSVYIYVLRHIEGVRGQLLGSWELVLSFYHVDPGDQTQVFRRGSKCLSYMNHLVGL